MIQANELRTGNVITYAGKIIVVTGVAGKTIYHADGHDSNIQPAYEPFMGIPLTEEILKDWCGFEKHGMLYDVRCGSTMLYLQAPNTMGEWQKCFCWVYDDYKFTNLQYLHQLQNLYLVLTGQELEVKLPIK